MRGEERQGGDGREKARERKREEAAFEHPSGRPYLGNALVAAEEGAQRSLEVRLLLERRKRRHALRQRQRCQPSLAVCDLRGKSEEGRT